MNLTVQFHFASASPHSCFIPSVEQSTPAQWGAYWPNQIRRLVACPTRIQYELTECSDSKPAFGTTVHCMQEKDQLSFRLHVLAKSVITLDMEDDERKWLEAAMDVVEQLLRIRFREHPSVQQQLQPA